MRSDNEYNWLPSVIRWLPLNLPPAPLSRKYIHFPQGYIVLRTQWTRGLQIFQKSRSHLQILGVRKVTRSKFHNADPQFWTESVTSHSPRSFCSVYVNWYTLLYCKEKYCSNYDEKYLSQRTKFSRPTEQTPGICAPLLYTTDKVQKHCNKERNIPPQTPLEFFGTVQYKNKDLYYSILRPCAVINTCV
jgi:hypothetical protein